MNFIESLIVNVFYFGFGAGIIFSILIASILVVSFIIKDLFKNNKKARH